MHMAPLFEPIVVFVVMSILVALFTWIYLRDRQREFGLWLLGWSAICVHFAVPLAAALLDFNKAIQFWLATSTLALAGSFFLLSVSRVLRHPRERALFFLIGGGPSLIYFAGLAARLSYRWFFVGVLILSLVSSAYQASRAYKPKSLYMRCLGLVVVPYAVLAIWQAAIGNPIEESISICLGSSSPPA